MSEAAPIIKPNVRFLFKHIAHFFALGFGSGLSPIMPGTAGTLFAWFSYHALMDNFSETLTPVIWGIVIVIGFCFGIWACHITGESIGKPDHGSIVWDEIIAFWLVLVFLPNVWNIQLAAFIVFRFFDMVKPQPIRYFDQRFKGGFGVMWDDILAAFFTLLCFAFWYAFSS